MKATPTPAILKILQEEGCGCDCFFAHGADDGRAHRLHRRAHHVLVQRDPGRGLPPGGKARRDHQSGRHHTRGLSGKDHWLYPEEDRLPLQSRRHVLARRVARGLSGHGQSRRRQVWHDARADHRAFRLLKAKGAEEFGIHAFLASNTLSNEYYPALARILFQLAVELQQETGCHITYINLSGGVGIPYRPEEPENDIAVIGEGVRRVYEEILVPAGMGDVALYTELGRFMLAPYGHLVTRAIHAKHIYKEYIGTDACACDLMRPAMYGSYHHITVMGKEDAPCDHTYDIVGGLCENNDKFAVDRALPRIDIGDLLVIHDAGATASPWAITTMVSSLRGGAAAAGRLHAPDPPC